MLAFSACLETSDPPAGKTPLSVEVLAAGGQCFPAPESWTAAWISSPEQLRETVNRCRADRIGGVAEKVPSVDFGRFGVLAVEMGRKRSAGYGFETGEVTAFAENGTATVILTCRQPASGAVTAQVMTAPWILVRMPSGAYRDIRIMDRNGRALTRISLP